MNPVGETPVDPEFEFDPPIVLVVEDEFLIRMDVAETLREAGHTTYEAGTADAAIELLRSPMRIDVVVTDVRMPGKIDGLGLAAYIREHRPSIKVIVMSGDYRPMQQEDALVFDRFLPKPLDLNSLINIIERLRDGTSLAADRSPPHARDPKTE